MVKNESERAFLRRLLITLAVVVLALALWQLRLVVLLIFAAALVAVLLDTIVDAIRHWTRLPRKLALLSAVLGLFAAIVGASWLFGAEATAQVRVLIDAVPSWSIACLVAIDSALSQDNFATVRLDGQYRPHKMRQVPRRHELHHRRWQQPTLLNVPHTKGLRHAASSRLYDREQVYRIDYSDGLPVA